MARIVTNMTWGPSGIPVQKTTGGIPILKGGAALTPEQSAALYKARVDAEKARIAADTEALRNDIKVLRTKETEIDLFRQASVDATVRRINDLKQSLANQGVQVSGYDYSKGRVDLAYPAGSTSNIRTQKQMQELQDTFRNSISAVQKENQMRGELYSQYIKADIPARASQLNWDAQNYYSPQLEKSVEASFERAGVTSAAARLQAGLPTKQIDFPLFYRPGVAVTKMPDVRRSLSPEEQEGAVYVGPGNVPQHKVFPQAERYGPGWSRETSRTTTMENALRNAELATGLATVPFMGAAALGAIGLRGVAGLGVTFAGGSVAAGHRRRPPP